MNKVLQWRNYIDGPQGGKAGWRDRAGRRNAFFKRKPVGNTKPPFGYAKGVRHSNGDQDEQSS